MPAARQRSRPQKTREHVGNSRQRVFDTAPGKAARKPHVEPSAYAKPEEGIKDSTDALIKRCFDYLERPKFGF